MDFVKAVILAVVEGITEFLPISSTGHLILVEDYLTLGDDPAAAKAFMVIIQFPAILSVVAYFWHDLWPLRRTTSAVDGHVRRAGPLPLAYDARIMLLWIKVAVAFLPAAVLGLVFKDFIEDHLLSPTVVACALITGGAVLIAIERTRRTERFAGVHEITFGAAFFIGVFQCLAMIPGTSRSAATIIGGMLLGARRPAAAEFSFFLAIPTMLGATAVSLAKHGLSFTPHQWAVLATGSAVSFLVAYASIAFLMNYIRRHDFTVFGWYRIALGALVLAVFALGWR